MSRGERILSRLDAIGIAVKEAEVVVQEADQPHLVSDFANTHDLPCKHRTEINLTLADAYATTAGHAHGTVMERVVRLFRPDVVSW